MIDTAQPTENVIIPGISCKSCGHDRVKTAWQTFSDGRTHLRADCASCGRFLRYLPQQGAPPAPTTPQGDIGGRIATTTTTTTQLAPETEGGKVVYVGMVLFSEGWQPVAKSTTVAGCWGALQSQRQLDHLTQLVIPSQLGQGRKRVVLRRLARRCPLAVVFRQCFVEVFDCSWE